MQYDLAVIGGGPGGKACALEAAQRGLKTALIEKESPGGIPVNKGYIPLKSMIEILAFKGDEIPSNPSIIKNESYSRIEKAKNSWEKALLKSGVTILSGTAEIISQKKLSIIQSEQEATILEAQNLVIASGNEPYSPLNMELDEEKGVISYQDILSSDKFLNLKRIAILGGDVEGCEFASFFKKLGAKVFILEMQDSIMPKCDHDLSSYLENEFSKQEITIETNSTVSSCNYNAPKNLEVIYTKNNSKKKINVEALLITGAYKPAFPKGIEKLDLEKTTDNFIKVDKYMRTSQEKVYAVGDIIGGISSANAAILEGKTAAKNIYGNNTAADYSSICYAFFTSPQLSGVGLREKDAKDNNINYGIKKAYFEDNFRALTRGQERGFAKLIIDKEQDILLGIHFAGDEVSELTPLSALACKEKLPLTAIKDLPLAHPTASEIIKEALSS